ncbi:MAG: hypothetical protein GKR90_06895 [Pseudomonadales bacterium]|nr:hypothetical protein [Pseudomonadales bacterium]
MEAPVLDGNISGDGSWRQIVPLSNFTQVQPFEGQPASEKTEVFIGFTDDTLYIGVICHDENPEQIIVSNSRRDSDLTSEDSIQFVVDSFRGEQDGFVFGTNAAGLEYDGQLVNTNTARFRETGFNSNWDTNWDVATQRGDYGWSAEFAIPFKSLRYVGRGTQTWNFNFQRIIRHKNEIAYWAPIPVQFSLNRLSLAGEVAGIEVPSARNIKITPYALGKTLRGGVADVDEDDSEFGVDIKYSLTPSLTLDLTYNTDFAQVEVDQQQVNLDRFSLFFPEKRPFFLENASQFSVGVPGELDLFFSRRIGIGPAGQQLPIDGGIRLSGKVRESTNIGVLHMRSEAVGGIAPETDFSVFRVKEEFANRSSLGVLFVNKDSDLSDNQTYAIDGQLGLGDKTLLSGFAAKTSTQNIDDDDHAFKVGVNRDGEAWSYIASYTEVGEGFNPEVGFLRRKGYRQATGFLSRRIRFGDDSPILEMLPHINIDGHWDFDGFWESGQVHIDHSTIWKSGAQLHTAVNLTHEGVKTPFEIVRGVTVDPGEYDHEELSIFSSTDSSAALSAGLQLVYGGFFGGDRLSTSPFVNYRIGESFSARLSLNHNDVELPNGDFEVNLSQLRLSYSFTPKISIQAFVQQNDRDDLLATNLRFSWLQSANSGFFVVYNETDDDRNAPGRPRREFILKYSYIFDV